MKYFTPEWYECVQKTNLHLLLTPDERAAVYDEALYQELYQKAYNKALEHEFEFHAVSSVELTIRTEKMWVDAGIKSQEEYDEMLVKAQKRDEERKMNPVDPEKVRAKLDMRLSREQKRYNEQLPRGILEQVADIRVLSLWVATSEIVAQITSLANDYQKYINEVFATQGKRIEDIERHIPEDVNKYFFSLHDTTVEKVEYIDQGIRLRFAQDRDNYKRVKTMTLTECEIIVMDMADNAWWKYTEFDICEDGRYEVGVLCGQGDRMSQIHVITKGIVFEANDYSEEEIREEEEKWALMEEKGLIKRIAKLP